VAGQIELMANLWMPELPSAVDKLRPHGAGD
jgi:hypothetical protein